MPASVGSPLGERVGSSSGERIPPAGAAPVSAVFSAVTVLRMNMVLILMGSVPERFGKESDLFYRYGQQIVRVLLASSGLYCSKGLESHHMKFKYEILAKANTK